MRDYMRSLWSRRTFIAEFSRSELREQNYGSIFGQLWLVLNPLLLSGVYFLLIYVIGGSSDAIRFGHLTASLFLFYLIANSLTGGVKAITSGQRLILNTSFPRIMLPISATVIALFKFIPTLFVFVIIHAVIGLPYSWQMLWAIPIFLIAMLMGLQLVWSLIGTVGNGWVAELAGFITGFLLSFLCAPGEWARILNRLRQR